MTTSAIKGILVSAALALASNPAMALSKKGVKKIANQEITKRAAELRNQIGPEGPQGPQGPQGPVGSKGSPAIELYAHVLADGSVVPAHSFGITQANVVLEGANRYCFTGLPYVNVGQVTVDYFQTSNNQTAKFSRRADPECEIFVQIFDGNGRTTTGGFFLMLY